MNKDTINKYLKSNYSLILIFLFLFILIRVFLLFIYKFPLNFYCGDSAYYIHLASNLSIASADRPSGYAMILSFFIKFLYTNWHLLFFIQSTISLLILLYSIHVLKNKISKKNTFLWILIVFFNLTSIFMEKSIMPDSISYNILILGTIISISGLNNKIKMIVLGITSGLLPLFRTNYVVFSLLLIFIAFIKELYLKKFNKKIFFNMSCTLVPFLLIYFIYINIFIYPRLGVKKISSFGGRTLFSRTMVFTDCKKLSELNLNKDFSKVLINFCTNSNLNNYSVNLFSTNGLIYKTDEYLNLDRAKSDSMYLDASKKILLNNPLIILKIFKESFTDTLISSSYFFETNIYPSLGGGCEFLPTKFNSNNNDFININKLNTNNKIILVIAKLASISQKVIVAIIYLIIPTYLVYSFLKSKKKMFIEKNWEIIIIWVATITYFTITLIFTGFDHRYIQPLWLSVAWIYLLVSSSK